MIWVVTYANNNQFGTLITALIMGLVIDSLVCRSKLIKVFEVQL